MVSYYNVRTSCSHSFCELCITRKNVCPRVLLLDQYHVSPREARRTCLECCWSVVCSEEDQVWRIEDQARARRGLGKCCVRRWRRARLAQAGGDQAGRLDAGTERLDEGAERQETGLSAWTKRTTRGRRRELLEEDDSKFKSRVERSIFPFVDCV